MATATSLVVRVRETTKGAPGFVTVVWSVVMTICMFGYVADHSHRSFALVAIAATFLLGAYLGWHRRTGIVFVAPAVSWLFAWFWLVVAEMIRHGFVSGLFIGLFLVTIGWIIIGGAEFLALMAIAWPFRIASRIFHNDTTITVENPFKLS